MDKFVLMTFNVIYNQFVSMNREMLFIIELKLVLKNIIIMRLMSLDGQLIIMIQLKI